MAAAAGFDPAAVREMRVAEKHLDAASGRIELSYAFDTGERFTERLDLGGPLPELTSERRRALDRAIDLLHLLAGVSYYKAAFPPLVRVNDGTVTAEVAALVHDVYRHGLAEAAYMNRLDAPVDIRLDADSSHRASAVGLGRRSLVPVGGGKDSIVALETVRRRSDVLLFSVGEAAPIRATAGVADLPLRSVGRTIDPRLLELNAHGARNGHVPVTAITSMIAVIIALIEGCDEVVMANERSASVGSASWQGIDVNHQWSKGWTFESALRDLIHAEIATDLDYFSLLRPWSELAIARRFASLSNYHQAFTSCNRVFRLRQAAPTWCGECDKCRFVTLVLAPWLPPADVIAIIGCNLLDDELQIDGFRALLGSGAGKPFECVGEIEENRCALSLLARPESAPWRTRLVQRLLGETPPPAPGASSTLLRPQLPHAVPRRYHHGPDAAL